MRSRIVPKILSRVLVIGAALLCLPMICAGIYDEPTTPFLYTIVAIMLVAAALAWVSRGAKIRSMRAEAEETLGDAFDPVAFHTFLLDIGPCQFDIIRDYFEDFLKQ